MTEPDVTSIAKTVTMALVSEGRLSVPLAAVDAGTAINADEFRIDSLAFIRAFIAMEDSLDIEFSDEALAHNRFATFGDVIDYVVGQVRAKEPA
jgi:acyl carrier protein